MHTLIIRMSAATSMLFAHSFAVAGPPAQVSEPGVLALAGVGAAVAIGIAIARRNRRK